MFGLTQVTFTVLLDPWSSLWFSLGFLIYTTRSVKPSANQQRTVKLISLFFFLFFVLVVGELVVSFGWVGCFLSLDRFLEMECLELCFIPSRLNFLTFFLVGFPTKND